MPNILLVGFPMEDAVKARERIDELMENEGMAGGDAIVTIIPAETQYCENYTPAPYVNVRHTDGRKAKKIAILINENLNLDIEWEQIGGFLAAKKVTPKS